MVVDALEALFDKVESNGDDKLLESLLSLENLLVVRLLET